MSKVSRGTMTAVAVPAVAASIAPKIAPTARPWPALQCAPAVTDSDRDYDRRQFQVDALCVDLKI